MNGALFAVIALYVVWRIAVIAGRRQERRRQASFPFVARVPAERCDRCGRYKGPEELQLSGAWPRRRRVCRGGCPPPEVGNSHDGEG